MVGLSGGEVFIVLLIAILLFGSPTWPD